MIKNEWTKKLQSKKLYIFKIMKEKKKRIFAEKKDARCTVNGRE